jgi:hypothetical protein
MRRKFLPTAAIGIHGFAINETGLGGGTYTRVPSSATPTAA